MQSACFFFVSYLSLTASAFNLVLSSLLFIYKLVDNSDFHGALAVKKRPDNIKFNTDLAVQAVLLHSLVPIRSQLSVTKLYGKD